MRGMTDESARHLLSETVGLRVNPMTCTLYESCVMFIRNNATTKSLFYDTYELMKRTGDGKSLFLSNQIPLSILIGTGKYVANIYTIPFQDYFTRYYHASNIINKT